MRGEDLAHVVGRSDAVAYRSHGGLEIQLPTIAAARDVTMLEGEIQVAERLVRLRVGPLHSTRGAIGLDVLLLGDEAPHLGEHLRRLRVVPVARPARPERVLVELQPLPLDAAEHHGAEPSVADGERLHPLLRGSSVPEREPARDLLLRHVLRRVARRAEGHVTAGDHAAGEGGAPQHEIAPGDAVRCGHDLMAGCVDVRVRAGRHGCA